MIGLAVAIVVLAFAFGTLVAMPLPIVTAIFGLATGLSLVGLLGHLIDVPSIAATLGTMLGLGVGIDYALFIVTRYRGFLAEGHGVEESVARATATSGGAVLFAGSTVVIALLALYFGGIPIVRALGYSAAIVVAVAVVAAVTLLPAILGAAGRADQPACGSRSASTPTTTSRTAGRAGRARSASDPLASAIVGLADPASAWRSRCSTSRSGSPTTRSCPRTPRRGSPTTSSAKGFGAGTNGPLLVSVKLDPPAKPNTKKLNQVEAQAAAAGAAGSSTSSRYAVPGGRPGGRGEPASPRRRRAAAGADAEAAAGAEAAEGVPRVDRRATRGWSSSATRSGKDPDVDDVSLPALNKRRGRGRLSTSPRSPRRSRSGPSSSSTGSATTSSPTR